MSGDTLQPSRNPASVDPQREAAGRVWHWSQSHLEIRFCRDDISHAPPWRHCDSRHAVIVHLGGQIDRLETELDGHGGCSGAALPGEIWTIPAGRNYTSHLRGGVIEYAFLLVPPKALEQVAEFRSGPQDFASVSGVRDTWLHERMRQLASLDHDDASDLAQNHLQHMGELICQHLFQAWSAGGIDLQKKGRTAPKLDASKARRLRAFIQENLGEPMKLEELASLARMTEHHFHTAFQQSFGTSPWQYIIRQRLRRAQHLLLNTRMDITTLALEAGFSSHSHLTSTFARHLGQTPKNFREASGGQS